MEHIGQLPLGYHSLNPSGKQRKIIEKNTAILDIGSGSVQISLFDKQVLYMTQNLDIGTAKVAGILRICWK